MLRESLNFTIIISTFIITAIVALIELLWRGVTAISVGYGIVTPVLLSIPLILFFVNENLQKTGAIIIKKLYFYFLLLILVNAPGSLILHKIGIQYDRILHFGVGFILLPALLLFYFLIYQMLKIQTINHKRILKIAFLIVLVGLFFWEGYQYIIDQFFETALFFDVAQGIEIDFWEDIAFGTLGLISALIYYFLSPKKLENIFAFSS